MAVRMLCMFLLLSGIAVSQTAPEIISAVSDRYEEMDKASRVTAVLQQWDESIGRNLSGEDKLDLSVSGDLARLIVARDAKPVSWILGQEFVWLYNPNIHAYQESERDAPESGKVRDNVRGMRDLLISRFIKLNDIHTVLTLNGEQDLRIDHQTHRCVKIKLEPATRDFTEEIWVETSTHLIWKSAARWKGRYKARVITWHKIETSQPIDPHVFQFDPPPGARPFFRK